MTVGQALECLRQGKKITKSDWKNMFIWMKPATIIKSEWCKDPILKEICESNGGEIEALEVICLKNPHNQIFTGWYFSDVDYLDDDWKIVE